MKIYKYLFLLFIISYSCSYNEKDVEITDALPPIFPDYISTTIPYNISPLNFGIANSSKMIVTFKIIDSKNISQSESNNQTLSDSNNKEQNSDASDTKSLNSSDK